MADYTQLQADVAEWFARGDMNIPLFISLGETELNRQLRVQAQQVLDSWTPTAQNANNLWTYDLPADFMEFEHLTSRGTRLELVSTNQLTSEFDLDYVYTIATNQLILPTADEVQVIYYQSIPVLSEQNQTNWLTENAYDALLYFCLTHGSYFMNNLAVAQNYTDIALNFVARVQATDDRSRTSGGPLVQRG